MKILFIYLSKNSITCFENENFSAISFLLKLINQSYKRKTFKVSNIFIII